MQKPESYNGRQPTDAELKLATLWSKAKEEVMEYFKNYDIRSNIIDYAYGEAFRVMEIPGFREGCRKIVSKYAKMVLREVFPKEKELHN